MVGKHNEKSPTLLAPLRLSLLKEVSSEEGELSRERRGRAEVDGPSHQADGEIWRALQASNPKRQRCVP